MQAPQSQSTQVDLDEARKLVEQLADFLKISGLYPSNNMRVQAAGQAVLQLAERVRGPRSRTIVRLASNTLSVDLAEIETGTGNVNWLREGMRKTAVTGIALDPEATQESLLAFADLLRRNTSTGAKRTTFEDLWGTASFEGIEVLERRFVSNTSWSDLPDETREVLEEDSPRGALLRHMLDTTDSLVDQLDKINEAVEDGQSTKFGGIQLVQRIVDLLPPELLENPQTGLEVVQMVLSSGAESVIQLQTMPEQQAVLEFRRLILEVSSRYFSREQDGEEEEVEDTAGPKGHAGDELITDSLEELLEEIHALPDATVDELAPILNNAEKLGVCLHQLLHSDLQDDSSGIEAHLAQLLPRLDDAGSRLLASYFEHLCSPTASEHQRQRLDQLLDLLQRCGMSHLLLSERLLSPRMVVASFPVTFGSFLDLIDPERPDDLAQVTEVCKLIGRDRVRKNSGALFGDNGILTQERLDKLFSVHTPVVAPFALQVLREGGPSALGQVASYLLALRLPGREGEALRVIDPPDQLPRSYLLSLTEGLANREPVSAQLQRASEELIRAYISEPTASPEHADRQARAVAALRCCWSPKTEQFVRGLATGTGFLRLKRRAKPIRIAAKTLLQSLHRTS